MDGGLFTGWDEQGEGGFEIAGQGKDDVRGGFGGEGNGEERRGCFRTLWWDSAVVCGDSGPRGYYIFPSS